MAPCTAGHLILPSGITRNCPAYFVKTASYLSLHLFYFGRCSGFFFRRLYGFPWLSGGTKYIQEQSLGVYLEDLLGKKAQTSSQKT